mmetsp:Transcript_17931/g.17998  ORF Transcript_17931/g.17998 Transcript_17931/m.17998 type:complete len:192 (-) Transcript_17931:74-649(-)
MMSSPIHILCLCAILSSINNISAFRLLRFPHLDINHGKRIGIVATVLIPFVDPIFPSIMDPSSVVHADSTGKMSTKLTAKRRYLPRIAAGVKAFNAAVKDTNLIKTFAETEFPPFKRAMSLYGASLRKGEVPDAISRKAEDLSDEVEKHVKRLSSISGAAVADELVATRIALDEYLTFAKLAVSSDAEYSN